MDSVKEGENVITSELADGWYRGAQGAWGHTYIYGTQTQIICQLELTNHAGMTKTVCTDSLWDWSCDGKRLFADLKESEVVDARGMPSYSGKARAVKFNAVLSASDNFPVKRHERFMPVLITTLSGKTVLDLGKNISGSVGFRLSAKNVQKLFLASGPGRYIPVSAGPENTL